MKHIVVVTFVTSVLLMTPSNGFAELNLGPEEIVQASGSDIVIGYYSVPSFVDWNNDDIRDLVIGNSYGFVIVYLNVGTQSNPQFSGYFYVQSDGSSLQVTPGGCLGAFPRVVYWDADERKDLLVGNSPGEVTIFLNNGTEETPTFDGGTRLQVGPSGSKSNIDVGSRACSSAVDWNSDGKKDLVVGALDGLIHLFINEGTDTSPDFITQTYAQNDGINLDVPSDRSSPDILDLDGDGNKDLITGNTDGQLLFYSNAGSDEDPNFSGYVVVEADGVPIYDEDTRSRPYVCYWTDDAYLDVIIGSSDGKVHLYQGIPEPGDLDADGDRDFFDFAEFALYWRQTGCGQCGGADLKNDDGDVNMDDLAEFTALWLTEIQ